MPRFSVLGRTGAASAFVCCAVLLSGLILTGTASAQGNKAKKGTAEEKKTGTIAKVEKKGKTAQITIEDGDGEKYDVQVTTKTNFVVHGVGDVSYFRHGAMFVSADNVLRNPANNYLSAKKFKIFLGGKGPGDAMEADPVNPDVYKIAGAVIDADDNGITVEAEGTHYQIAFEGESPAVTFESTEPEHAVVGSTVEVEGVTKAGKFHPNSISVTLDKPLSANDAFASGDKKAPKSKAKTAKKTPTKADRGGDKPTEDGGENAKTNSADPFNVLGGGEGGDSKKDSKKGDKAKSTPKKKKTDGDSDMN
ncbi:MAG: hypothetical protein JSS02_10430 [Planctomycetes bacterium]|nr:hypothetical protein [Planctomycetota bacterium]